MPYNLRHPSVQFPNQTATSPLRIIVVYDGFTDLIRVNDIWSRLVARFRDEIQIVSCVWNFTLLRDRQLRECAAQHAAEADLIVLSTSGRRELPDYIRLWLNLWLPWKKGRCAALVAALDQEPPVRATARPLRNYLRRAAKQNGMDFFCNMNQGRSLTGTGASL